MLSVILALGAALSWGISDFLGGLKSRSMALLSVLLISQGTGLVLLSVIVIALGQSAPDGRFLLYAAAAGLGELFGVAALYRGLSVGTMSIVAPVAAIAPVVPLVAGLALGEVPGPIQGAGLVLIVAGVVLASRQSRSAGQEAQRPGPSIFYGLLSALGFGIFFVAMDAASAGNVPWALLVARLAALTAIASVVVLGRSRLAMQRTDLPMTVLIGVLIVSADFLYATATTIGFLGVVAVLGALHTVVTIGLARIYLHERLAWLQGIGIVTCLCGVLAVSAF